MRQRSPLQQGTITPQEADQNDILVVIRRDGDTTVHDKVRNEYGLLNSDSGDASIIGAEPAMVISWTTLDAGGIPTGGAYVIDQEQPPPGQIGRFIRGSLREQYIATTALKTAKQKKETRNANIAYWAVAGVCILVILVGFVLLPMWNSFQVRKAIEQSADRPNPIVAPTPLPTRTPLPTIVPEHEPDAEPTRAGPIPRSRQ